MIAWLHVAAGISQDPEERRLPEAEVAPPGDGRLIEQQRLAGPEHWAARFEQDLHEPAGDSDELYSFVADVGLG